MNSMTVVQRLRDRKRKLQDAPIGKALVALDGRLLQVNRAFGRQLDSYLDAGFGSGILTEYGALVANALKYFHGQRY